MSVVSDNITFDFVWGLYLKEKQTNQLLQLNKSFYGDVGEYLKKAQVDEHQRLNMQKMLVELFERRKQKILLYITYKKPLPQPIAAEESDFYNRIADLSNTYRFDLSIAQIKNDKILRSLTDMSEIMLPSGKKFGPVKKDEVVELSGSDADADYLVKNSICEIYNR